ncbi:MAG: NUDIX hydrolase [Nanoarchaeota archaeon]|nr:NUDIX hydrolase [Nanoarchaeota archaeon]
MRYSDNYFVKDSVFGLIKRGEDENLEFVCYKENKKNKFNGRLRFYGGGIEEGETYDLTLKRELKEELDLHMESCKLLKEIRNTLGGVGYLCYAEVLNLKDLKHKEEEMGEPQWLSVEELFKSNLVPNSKLLLYLYLLSYSPHLLSKHIDVIKTDVDFLLYLQENFDDIYKDFIGRLRGNS